MTKKYEYVFSAGIMFDLCPMLKHEENNPDHIIQVEKLTTKAIERLKTELVNCDVSILFNAFTEKHCSQFYNDHNKFGLSNVFVDSGGLQMVTRNMQITEEQKIKIYEVQSKHEFAMCFDEIPCRDREGFNNGNSRTNISAKLYYPDLKETSALKTAENIKKQIEYFRTTNSNAKIFYIIQGNTYQDMIEWYEVGKQLLTSEDYKYIAGLALADTCMGNGKLETVDMIRAFTHINKDPDLKNSNRLHLLGVGSIGRLYPFFLLEKMIGENIITSFDSTSFSQAIYMNALSNGLSKMKGNRSMNFVKEAAEYFFESNQIEDGEKYINHLLLNFRKKKLMYSEIPESLGDLEYSKVIVRSLIIFITIYQLKGFDNAITDILSTMSSDNSPEGMLQNIRSDTDFDQWYSEYGRFIDSKRIERYNPQKISLEEFFI